MELTDKVYPRLNFVSVIYHRNPSRRTGTILVYVVAGFLDMGKIQA